MTTVLVVIFALAVLVALSVTVWLFLLFRALEPFDGDGSFYYQPPSLQHDALARSLRPRRQHRSRKNLRRTTGGWGGAVAS